MSHIIQIDVTREHIIIGEPGDPHCCPIAIALSEQHGLPERERTEYMGFANHENIALETWINHRFWENRYLWHTPPEMLDFMKRFDAADPDRVATIIKPASFHLDIREGI